ncbi:MAG: vWA domain-containing protein [Planctomycetaceae bacterium]
MRALLLSLLLSASVAGGEAFPRALADLRTRERSRRLAALRAFAEGEAVPAAGAEETKLETALVRFLSPRWSAEERALAARALVRRPTARTLDALLEHMREERDDRFLDEACPAFRHGAEALAARFKARVEAAEDPLERAVLLRAMGFLPAAAARPTLRVRAAADPHPAARAAAAHALALDRDPAAFPPLLAMLDEEDPGLVTAACESLGILTRREFGREPARWKTWWEGEGSRDPLAPPPVQRKEEEEGGGEEKRRYAHELEEPGKPTQYYFGIPVKGTRTVFCCDVSASMRYKLPLANDQLARAVKGLPSSALFEVVFFNEWVTPWRNRLSRADPVTKELLVRHLPDLEIKSYTNLFDALELALGLKPEEIFLISDGEPNRGRKILPRDILTELEKINPRKVRVHTVSVVRTVDGHTHVPLLKEIAEATGGRYEERTVR